LNFSFAGPTVAITSLLLGLTLGFSTPGLAAVGAAALVAVVGFAVLFTGGSRGEGAALVAGHQLEKIGNVSRMERLDQGPRALGIALIDRIEHRADEFGLQQIVRIELVALAAAQFGLAEIGLAHH
jgi:hypothetical protein